MFYLDKILIHNQINKITRLSRLVSKEVASPASLCLWILSHPQTPARILLWLAAMREMLLSRKGHRLTLVELAGP